MHCSRIPGFERQVLDENLTFMPTKFLTLVFATSLVSSLAACGGSELDPGAGDDPGTGTATLVVTGSVTARNQLTNALTAADFATDFAVRVMLNGQQVTTGTVTITSASGTYPLTFQLPGQTQLGRWIGSAPAYDEVYKLDVVSGADNLHGVRVDGPNLHSFSAPTVGAQIAAGAAVPLAWNVEATADSAAIRTDRVDGLAVTDSGSYSLADGSLKVSKDKAEPNTIRLTRTNRTTPAGGAGGSELTVSVENEIDVIALANPNAP